MDFKRISAACMALVLCGGMTSALAAGSGQPLLVSPVPGQHYTAKVSVNGVELESVTFENTDPVTYESTEVTLDMASLPAAPAGYVPARMVCAADTDNGYTYWSIEDNSAVFALHKTSVIVHFEDMSIELDGQSVEGEKAYLSQGVTFLPVSFLATLPNVEVDDHPEMDSLRYDIKLVVTPLEELANTIKAETESGANFEISADDLQTMLEIPTENMVQVVAYCPLMTNPDTLIIAQIPAEKQGEVLEAFEAYRASKEATFSWYLTQHLEKTQKAKIVSEGDFVMLFIGENQDRAEELFVAGVQALAEAE